MRLKKRIGSKTLREAQLTLWTRWNVQRFDAGTEHTKNEMEIGTENRNITEWFKKAAEWNPDLTSRKRTNRAIGRPRKDGKTTSTTSSNKFMKKKMKNQSKEGFKTTIIGSTSPKIGENGLDLKENTQ